MSAVRAAERSEPSEGANKRLVFGLSARTNKLKHDEYAEKRSNQRPDPVASSNRSPSIGMDQNGTSSSPESPARITGKIHASKCGNFYKATQEKSTREPSPETVSTSPSVEPAASPAPTPRKQFTIPPPPKVNSSKSSVVSYAKSRIYDKPAKTLPSRLLADSSTGVIPDAISSGFKPPKQVNVSKAREKWEGGEPFAKCKSRQRLLAAKAGKFLDGSWSMTSLVATQQLQFQQALEGSSAPARSTRDPNEPPVKILTRGSVLERVQQYEKTPLDSSNASEPQMELSEEASIMIACRDATNEPLVLHPVLQPTPSPTQLGSNRRLSLRRRSSSNSNMIPRFHHPNGRPNTYEIEVQKRNIVASFDKLPERKANLTTGPTSRRQFHSIAIACGFSEYFKEPLRLFVRHGMSQGGVSPSLTQAIQTQRKQSIHTNVTNTPSSQMKPLVRAASIDTANMDRLKSQDHVSCEQFLVFWRQLVAGAYDNAARFVHLLTLGQRNYLQADDFIPLVQSVIDDHPGLKFLRAAPDFHMRYTQTVIARIYFCVNRSWTGKISVPELRQSNLLKVIEQLALEEDINQVTEYFSYEHFYVIYCKFWSLDQDHDLLISKEDLARHNDAAISSRIIERIFMGIVSRQIKQTGKMSYTDFVWFLIAEEDKKHPRSIEYWFRLMDIDGDGYISMYEMEYFYYEQTKRLELMNIEPLPFIDSACQILDLVGPKEKNKIALSDLKRTKMATIFFDTFINLEKYLEHESREFVSTRDVIQNGKVVSDWDRYASEEYESLVSEESNV